jgi:uncharacterized protein YoxC
MPMVWAEVLTAISTAIIALVVLAVGVMLLALQRDVRALMRTVDRTVDHLDRDARPALDSARKLVDDASQLVSTVRSETDGIVHSSKDVRKRLEQLINRTEDRLHDLDALIDVVQTEVEETALDVAAALRTTRRGASVFRSMKRAFLKRGR